MRWRRELRSRLRLPEATCGSTEPAWVRSRWRDRRRSSPARLISDANAPPRALREIRRLRGGASINADQAARGNQARLPPNRDRAATAAANALAAIGIARKRFRRSIQRPGFGSLARSAGMKATSRNGSASPVQVQRTRRSIRPAAAAVRCPARRPGTAPRRASRQMLLALRSRSCPRAGPRRRATGSSNRPSRLAVIATASRSSSMIVRGSCSWNAQPASAPAARISEQNTPSAPVPTTAPAV